MSGWTYNPRTRSMEPVLGCGAFLFVIGTWMTISALSIAIPVAIIVWVLRLMSVID